ncbi:MAG: hypothetical protein AB7I30_19100 [Isosphaeraceae bacterium]
MNGLSRLIEGVLQGRPSARSWGLAVACGMGYGLVMGSFGGRVGQSVLSALKVPLLLSTTVALSLPSFFIVNTLRGLRADFGEVLRALIGSQAALTVVLVSLAPLTAFFYASTTNYRAAILFNGLMFGAASVAAQVPLRRSYRQLIERDPRHRGLIGLWLLLYAFVGIQMGWVLRPFIGDPTGPTQFFREGAWDNAYMAVAGMVAEVLGISR